MMKFFTNTKFLLKMPPKINTVYIKDIKEPWNINYGCAKSRFGDVQLGILNDAVCFLYFSPPAQIKTNINKLAKRWPKANFSVGEAISMQKIADKIFAEEDKENKIEVILGGTDFQHSVWQTLLEIPSGDQWTYSECAEQLGKPSAVRAVANAVGSNEVSFLIPCHRVVSKDGNKFKYRWGAEVKKTLLNYEAEK